jgi:hypothetical protein
VCERPIRGRDHTTNKEHIMKNTTTKPTLALRAHSIRNLTAAELRIAHGGDPQCGSRTHGTCGSAASNTK